MIANVSKKASAEIVKHIQKINSKHPKNISWETAWNILSEEWKFEADIAHTRKDKTVFTLYRDGQIIETYYLGDMWDEKNGDLYYANVLKHVLENITRRRLYKVPKKSSKKKDTNKTSDLPHKSRVDASKHNKVNKSILKRC